jgi:hypothetical protein
MDLPLSLQTAYQELLRLHAAVPRLSIDASIVQRTKGGKHYWVARKRAGDSVHEVAIGPDTDDTRKQVKAARAEQETFKAWSRAAAASVAALRAGRCLAPDMQTGKLLAAIARSGFFVSGGILGGTQAFRHYPLMLSVDPPSTAFSTAGDVDLIASNAVQLSGAGEGLVQRLRALGIKMDAVLGLHVDLPPRWQIEARLELSFQSSLGRSRERSRHHAGIGERVQTLRHIEFTFVDPVETVSLYRSGVPIRVPSPERYALHKLIVAQLRPGQHHEKRLKDLRQAEWLIGVLSERRAFELWNAWDDLCRRGPKWQSRAQASLAECPQIQCCLQMVEDQFGPAGQ